MPFRFPLEVVFHLRQSVEHQQELRLRSANQQVGRVRHMVEQIDLRIRDIRVQQSRELSSGTSAAELRFGLLRESMLRQQRDVGQTELLRLEKLRNEQQKIFQQARRDREMLERLRDRQLHEFQRDAERREQRQLDDLFLMRCASQKRG